MKIPSNRQWTQTNSGDILGVLNQTHNISFSKQGEAQLSKRAIAIADSQTTDFGEVMSIVYFDGNYYAVTDNSVFEFDLSNPAAAKESGSPTLGAVSDGIVCYSRLYVSDTTALAYLAAGGGWTTGIGSLTSSNPHPLAVFDSQSTYKLAVGDGNQVKTYDSSGNLNSTVLSLPANYMVTSISYRNSYLYIGTKERNGGEAAVFLWNGDGTNAQFKIDVGASWIYSLTPYRGTVAMVTNEGELLAVNGSSVMQLAVFPIFHEDGIRWEANDATRGKVYSRGMVALGDVLYINASGSSDVGDSKGMRSGVWCFDPAVGLYHYASPTTDKYVSDSSITVSSSVITTSTAHNLTLGDTVYFAAVSGLTGVSTFVKYYAVPVTTTTLKLAGNRTDAFSGNTISITGSVSGDTFCYAPNTDKGETKYADSGAIALTSYLSGQDVLFESDIIFASELRTESGTERDVLCTLTSTYNHGSFTTQKIFTENLKQVWKSLYPFFSGIHGSNERIIVKYRDTAPSDFPTEIVSVTWIDDTTFTTTDVRVQHLIQKGYEVVFLRGYGQGTYSVVSDVNQSTATLEVKVEDSVGVAGATSSVRFTNFKKVKSIDSSRTELNFDRATIDTKNNWVQLKVDLRGFDPSIQMLELSNSIDQSTV